MNEGTQKTNREKIRVGISMKKHNGKTTAKFFSLIAAIAFVIVAAVPTASAVSAQNINNGYLKTISIFGLDQAVQVNPGVTEIAPGCVWSYNWSVKSLYIPSSVTKIGSKAFTNLSKLQNVYIDNYDGAVDIASDAFPSSAAVIYSQTAPVPATSHTTENTTGKTAENTTEKQQSQTVTDPTENTSAPAASAVSTAAGSVVSAPFKAKSAVPAGAPTTVQVTQPASPLAGAGTGSGSSADETYDWWNALINPETTTAVSETSDSTQKNILSGKKEKILARTALCAVAASALAFGYLKFRK